MKLYLWDEPHGTNYGSSMVFSVAESLPQARKIAMSNLSTKWSSVTCENSENINAAIKAGLIKLGKPTRVVNLPCAEWHKWEE